MLRKIKHYRNRAVRIICIGIIGLAVGHNLNAQILLGVSYGNDISSALGDPYSRSGAQIGASYFISPNIAFGLDLEFFGKTLIDSTFSNVGTWQTISELFSARYYFLTSDFRPYAGVAVGHSGSLAESSDSDIELSKGFNVNSVAVAPEIGFLANVSPRLKLTFSARYNVPFGHDPSVSMYVGLRVPLIAE